MTTGKPDRSLTIRFKKITGKEELSIPRVKRVSDWPERSFESFFENGVADVLFSYDSGSIYPPESC